MVEIIFGNHQCEKCKKDLDYAVTYQYKKLCIDCYTKEMLTFMNRNNVPRLMYDAANIENAKLKVQSLKKSKVKKAIMDFWENNPQCAMPINDLLEELGLK